MFRFSVKYCVLISQPSYILKLLHLMSKHPDEMISWHLDTLDPEILTSHILISLHFGIMASCNPDVLTQCNGNPDTRHSVSFYPDIMTAEILTAWYPDICNLDLLTSWHTTPNILGILINDILIPRCSDFLKSCQPDKLSPWPSITLASWISADIVTYTWHPVLLKTWQNLNLTLWHPDILS